MSGYGHWDPVGPNKKVAGVGGQWAKNGHAH